MLNRRILRVKAFKTIYCYAENRTMSLKDAEALLELSCEATRDLYLFLLSIVGPLTREAVERITAAKSKFNPSEEARREADRLLTAHELVKGKVLETALMSPREVSDALCEVTGAEGIACVGNKFVIWRFSEKCQEARNQTGRAKRKEVPKSKADPVGKGVRARRAAAKKVREQRNQYFRQQAIEKSIERSREKQLRGEE